MSKETFNRYISEIAYGIRNIVTGDDEQTRITGIRIDDFTTPEWKVWIGGRLREEFILEHIEGINKSLDNLCEIGRYDEAYELYMLILFKALVFGGDSTTLMSRIEASVNEYILELQEEEVVDEGEEPTEGVYGVTIEEIMNYMKAFETLVC